MTVKLEDATYHLLQTVMHDANGAHDEFKLICRDLGVEKPDTTLSYAMGFLRGVIVGMKIRIEAHEARAGGGD